MMCPNNHGELVNNTCQVCGYVFTPLKKKTVKKQNVVEEVNSILKKELLAAKLSGEVAPWQQKWFIVPKRNYVSDKPYKGVNRFLLSNAGDDYFITKKQIEGIKNARLTEEAEEAKRLIVFWLPPYANKQKAESKDEENEKPPKNYPIIRAYWVYPAKYVEGLPKKETFEKDATFQTFDDLIKRHGIKVDFAGSEAFYDATTNSIVIPSKGRFESEGEFYITLARFIARWAYSQLSDKEIESDKEKGRNELMSEICANYICAYFGINIESTVTNSVAYIQYWLDAAEADYWLFTSAAQRAEKVLDLLGLS